MERIESKQVLVETQPEPSKPTCVDSSSQTEEGLQMATDDNRKDCGVMPNGLTPIWEDVTNGNADRMDDVAKEAAKRVLLVDLSAEVEDPSLTESFKSHVVARVRSDPLYCSTPACMNNTNLPMGSFARHLHDAFFMYGAALRRADTAQPNGRQNANVMTRAMEGSFEDIDEAVHKRSHIYMGNKRREATTCEACVWIHRD
ncbi:hypothetical protein ANCCEY_13646 [Ancylostoma ceylanicum]|uniref:Uncharacterized protein n=1 Tax=Ancylostoma ceylanicum TaxID=53326 RepID=A0A0D6L731_9BILA|nr:hypothetical protein ANCCEY_13646 [Ancylostoma ceylanicum]